MIEKWDWYGQTACLAAAAAQDPARVGRSQDHRKCRNLTRKPNQSQSKNQQQQMNKQTATKFYEIHTKGS